MHVPVLVGLRQSNMRAAWAKRRLCVSSRQSALSMYFSVRQPASRLVVEEVWYRLVRVRLALRPASVRVCRVCKVVFAV